MPVYMHATEATMHRTGRSQPVSRLPFTRANPYVAGRLPRDATGAHPGGQRKRLPAIGSVSSVVRLVADVWVGIQVFNALLRNTPPAAPRTSGWWPRNTAAYYS